MKPSMYYNGIKISKFEKIGRCVFALLENGQKIKKGFLKKKDFEIECEKCSKRKHINFYYGLDSKDYICQSCNKIGEKNPFYGKCHSDELKNRLSNDRKGKWLVGSDNPYFGKKHTYEIRERIRKNTPIKYGKDNAFYGKHHDEKTKKIIKKKIDDWRNNLTDIEKLGISKRISNSQHRLKNENPDEYRRLKQKAAYASHKSNKKYKRNKIEKLVENFF